MKILVYIALLLEALWTLFCSILGIITFSINEKLGQTVHRMWSKGVGLLLGIRADVHGIENLKDLRGAILAPNHLSIFDITLLGSLPIDFKWISKEEVGRIPFMGWTMRTMGCFFLNRKSTGSDLNVLKNVEDGLRQGKNTVIFPEGTRSRTGERLPLKKGAFRCAQNSGAYIVPILIQGSYAIAPAGKLPSRIGHRVRLTIDKPWKVLPTETLEVAMERYIQCLNRMEKEH